MVETFVDKIRNEREELTIVERLIEGLQDCNDYHLEIAKFDNRGNPALIEQTALLILQAEIFLNSHKEKNIVK